MRRVLVTGRGGQLATALATALPRFARDPQTYAMILRSTSERAFSVGGDIREGKVTLPVIIAMQKVAPDDRTLIEGILEKGSATPADVDLVRRLVEETGSIEATREAAAEYIDRALRSIRPLPHSVYRDSLELLAEGILSRRK